MIDETVLHTTVDEDGPLVGEVHAIRKNRADFADELRFLRNPCTRCEPTWGRGAWFVISDCDEPRAVRETTGESPLVGEVHAIRKNRADFADELRFLRNPCTRREPTSEPGTFRRLQR